MGEIFLSYSRLDRQFADELSRGLTARGLEVWVDREEIEAGDAWRAAISEAIASCDAFLVLLSPNSVTSKNVAKELSIAESRDRHIVPVKCRQCEISPAMEYQLADLQWIDFSEMPFEDGLDRLVRALHVWHVKPPPKPPPPQPPPVQGPQALAQLLCGRWEVQIGAAYLGAVARLLLDLYPNGAFNGQLMSPMGMSTVTGQWQVTPMGQLTMQGQQTMGWTVSPYAVLIQFTQVSPAALAGVSGVGEQVVWRKAG